jgi:hypothetical protein
MTGKFLLLFIISFTLLSCTRETPQFREGTRQKEEERKFELTKIKPDTEAARNIAPDTNEINILKFDKNNLPSLIEYKGKILDGASWTDKNGDNILIITQTEVRTISADESEQYLYAYHYVNHEDGYTLLWSITDFVRSYCDVNCDYLPGTLEITDIDKDGIAESLFLYKLDDRCDVSPIPIKLMMHSGGKKLVIRGSIGVDVGGGQRVEGEKHIDAAFKTSPPAFKDYASEKWDKFVKGYRGH